MSEPRSFDTPARPAPSPAPGPSASAPRAGGRRAPDPTDVTPVFVISVAAELSGMHPQTLRQYDRLGLVSPGRAAGRGRRYSVRDVALLREVQRLSQDEGVNLAGVKRIIELEAQVQALQAQLRELHDQLDAATAAAADREAKVHASYRRDLVPVRKGQVVVYQPSRPHRPQT